jgi:TrpR family trp operon transcriptional repressor
MKSFTDFIDLIYAIPDRDLLEDFLVGVTTAKERQELPQRVEIVTRLVAGEPQAKIAKELGVGVATITRGSKELASGRFTVIKRKIQV